MPKDLSQLFYPRSVAVIGASNSKHKVGAIVLKNILNSGFKGRVYPVNPTLKKIGKLRCYGEIGELPETPDLAVIAIPAEKVNTVIEQAGVKGVKNVVVYAAGYKEIGPDGATLEQCLKAVAERHFINLLGPNCLGFVNSMCPINATFGQPLKTFGNLRFITQSGAIAASLFDWCNSTGVGFSEFITLGNKTILSENDILQYFFEQGNNSLTSLSTSFEGESKCHPIGMYLESISGGKEFIRLTKEITKTDPVFILKPGKTKEAVNAMQSHTGALAGEDDVLDIALNEAGAIRCNTLEDFFDYAKAFSWEDCPKGPKVAVISNAGGPAVISADEIVTHGLQLAKFDSQTHDELKKALPRFASIVNPVDVLGDALADRFAGALDIVLKSNEVDAVVVILTPQIMTQITKTAQAIKNASEKYHKPVVCSFIGGSLVAKGEEVLNKSKIPSFNFPERAIGALSAMWAFSQKQKQKVEENYGVQTAISIQNAPSLAKSIIEKAIQNNQVSLTNLQAADVLASVGINVPPSKEVSDLTQAISFAKDVGWPVVLKLSSPGLLHKKKVGGVVMDIRDEPALEKGWETLQRKIQELSDDIKSQVTIQVQKEVPDGIEVILGVKSDPTFGQVMLFGAGGSVAELVADKNMQLLPVESIHAQKLVEKSKVYALLKGFSGEPSYALDKLYDLMVRFGKLVESLENISAFEINPVIVTLTDVWAVDGKVIINLLHRAKRDIIKSTKTSGGIKFKTAKTLSHTVQASTYHYFEFEPEAPLDFIPGQYISVKVADSRINCYSVADCTGNTKFNLFVDTKPGGPGSNFFETLKVGDPIYYIGPFGTFGLKPDDGAKTLLFLATGSGCAPFRCMIEHALREKGYTKPITLYIGLNHSQDVFWIDYLENLKREFTNFNYKIAVWKPDNSWKGHVGFITDLVKQDYPDASQCSAYLCGAKPMIDSATELLKQLGCLEKRIYMEKF